MRICSPILAVLIFGGALILTGCATTQRDAKLADEHYAMLRATCPLTTYVERAQCVGAGMEKYCAANECPYYGAFQEIQSYRLVVAEQLDMGKLTKIQADALVDQKAREVNQRIATAEAQERERKAAAWRAAAATIQQNQQNQQMMNALNRPTITNCQRTFGGASCTTY